MRFHVIAHACPRIRDANDEVLARDTVTADKDRLRLRPKVYNRGLESELAAIRHRVARVDGEVQNDLVELGGVDFEVGGLLLIVQMAEDMNVFAEQPKQRTLKIGDNRVDLQYERLERLAPTEGEEMSSDD